MIKYLLNDLIDHDLLIYFRFCPSVFFYLCTVIPSVWFLELDLAERRSKFNVTQAFTLMSGPQGNLHFDTDDTLPVKNLSFFHCLVYHCFLNSLFHGKFQLKCGHKLLNKHYFLFLLLDVGYSQSAKRWHGINSLNYYLSILVQQVRSIIFIAL